MDTFISSLPVDMSSFDNLTLTPKPTRLQKRLKAANEELKRAKAQLARIVQKKMRIMRKRRARQHLILGTILMKQMFEKPGVDEIALNLIGQMSERDRPLFAEIEEQLTAKIASEASQRKPKKPTTRRATARKRNSPPKSL